MNAILNKVEAKPVIYLKTQVVGLTSPEIQTLAQETIKAIAKMTKKSLKAVGSALAIAFRYIERKWNEGAEMHNRMVALQDERYARNPYPIRSF